MTTDSILSVMQSGKTSSLARLACAVIGSILLLGSCDHEESSDPTSTGVIPDFAGLRLNDAKDDLESIDVEVTLEVRDALGNRAVLRDSNWRVVDQSPKPGSRVEAGAQVCVSVLKNDEYTDKPELKLSNACNAASITESAAIATSSTIGRVTATKDGLLEELGISLEAGSRVAMSESVCGIFSFLVSADGRYHFYEWTNNEWAMRTKLTEGLLTPTLKGVEAVDVTGDSVRDFFVTLPT